MLFKTQYPFRAHTAGSDYFIVHIVPFNTELSWEEGFYFYKINLPIDLILNRDQANRGRSSVEQITMEWN